MYAILFWMDNDNYVTYIHNADGSVMLFETLREADKYVNQIDPTGDSARVISIESVKE